jgi:hypothetical protein
VERWAWIVYAGDPGYYGRSVSRGRQGGGSVLFRLTLAFVLFIFYRYAEPLGPFLRGSEVNRLIGRKLVITNHSAPSKMSQDRCLSRLPPPQQLHLIIP